MSAAEYRKVFGLFKYYHRAAVTLAVLSLSRAAIGLLPPAAVPGAWVDGMHFACCALGCGYVAAPYTRRFLEMITLVRERP
ncbi:hypothetical protein ACFFX1_48060 [Dactylosporangium sucinum]|uniref:Uncharacterized protein n=1 Tax=Dactylosporangium sucinum TaxID=1424081 RepID=A0A917TNM3_9ACTN|nr:hypothetical protein [Dactylosporangium sucinum]GGM29659.1 hypothetical protein GCM10007977_033690 [Dactylosporangium sucinum]